jgi:hypothetical protein
MARGDLARDSVTVVGDRELGAAIVGRGAGAVTQQRRREGGAEVGEGRGRPGRADVVSGRAGVARVVAGLRGERRGGHGLFSTASADERQPEEDYEGEQPPVHVLAK